MWAGGRAARGKCPVAWTLIKIMGVFQNHFQAPKICDYKPTVKCFNQTELIFVNYLLGCVILPSDLSRIVFDPVNGCFKNT